MLNHIKHPRKFTKIWQVFIALVFVLSLIGVNPMNASAAITFTGTELLGRPEADRISISVVPQTAIQMYYQTSTSSSGPWTKFGSTVSAPANAPTVVTITGLSANTKYYYRMQYSTDGSSWTIRPTLSFQTARAAGSTFTFAVTTDSHINIMLGNSGNWQDTLDAIADDGADFLIDLGDTAAMDNGTSSVALGDTAAAEQKYKDTLPYFNTVSGSSPIFLVAGNHEQQEAWHLQGTLANSLPIMAKNAEKKYFLNPSGTDSFYNGDAATQADLSGNHLKDDYFAWTWGDALFVVINPFWYTTTKPYTTTVGGGETDATGSGNRWDWTLGQTQFNWLKSTLAGSNAKYKFVFSHQIVGGNGMTSPNQVGYGHGGADSAKLVEWGGYNIDGTTLTWSTNRSGWGSQAIADVLVANHVTAFFHGHDHQAAHEAVDGVVYQAVPSGSFTGSFGNYTTGGNSGKTIWADSTQGPGYLKVTVAPAQTTVNFIRNTDVSANSYTMAPYVSVVNKVRDDYDGDGKTDAAKFVASTGTGWWLKSSTGLWDGKWLGSDTFAYFGASDYDGDGKTDPAKFYSGTGTVWWVKSTTGVLDGQWLGPDTFTYVTGSDFDGDGKADPAKFYPATGTVWWVKSTTHLLSGQWLGGDTFTYVSGSDFDGDGKTDPGKFYPATGTVWWVKSTTGVLDGKWLGADTFTYVPASDFDGDGKTDPAKYYSAAGNVWWVKSSTGVMDGAWMGSGTFTYVPGCDFNGDGKTDPTKYTASTHTLSWLNVGTGTWTDIDTQSGTYTLALGQ